MNLQVMAATLVVLAFVLFLLAARSRKMTGIPSGEVFYQDLPGQPFFGKPLRSSALGISGKPDCLEATHPAPLADMGRLGVRETLRTSFGTWCERSLSGFS
jgi:hypothetical protein